MLCRGSGGCRRHCGMVVVAVVVVVVSGGGGGDDGKLCVKMPSPKTAFGGDGAIVQDVYRSKKALREDFVP
jgi:hypothetical protein